MKEWKLAYEQVDSVTTGAVTVVVETVVVFVEIVEIKVVVLIWEKSVRASLIGRTWKWRDLWLDKGYESVGDIFP